MRFMSKLACAIAIAAATATAASAADVRHHDRVIHHRAAPYAFDGAYDSTDHGSERFSGSSVPYDADGPGYNDFQLQGR
jgi:hypothetical protein